MRVRACSCRQVATGVLVTWQHCIVLEDYEYIKVAPAGRPWARQEPRYTFVMSELESTRLLQWHIDDIGYPERQLQPDILFRAASSSHAST